MSSTTNRKELLDAIEPTQEGIHMYLEGKSRKLTDRELSYLLRKNTALYKRVIDNNLTFDDIRYFLLTNTPIEPKYCEVCHKQVHILHGHISRGFPRTCSNVYKAMGFEYIGDSKPSYVYANRNGQILSRYQCQKARIAEEEDNELRETEIMAKKGYFKVYDCGNLIYAKKF